MLASEMQVRFSGHVFLVTSMRGRRDSSLTSPITAISARNGSSTDAVVDLVKSALKEPSVTIKEFCQPATLRLVRDATKQSEEVSCLFLLHFHHICLF